MKSIIGGLLVAAGLVGGLYMGLWWAFIGGIVDVVEAFKADDIEAAAVAWGIVKVFFAGLIGWVSAIVFMIPGMALLSTSR